MANKKPERIIVADVECILDGMTLDSAILFLQQTKANNLDKELKLDTAYSYESTQIRIINTKIESMEDYNKRLLEYEQQEVKRQEEILEKQKIKYEEMKAKLEAKQK